MASGLLLACASRPGPWGVLAFVALVPLLRSAAAGPPLGAAAAAGLGTGVVFFGLGFGFVPAAQVGAGPGPPVVWAVGVLLLGAPFAAVGMVLARLARRSPAAALCVAPAAWVGLEALRSHPALGMPWLHLPYALADHPAAIQSASVLGLYGMSAWIAAVNAAVAGAALVPARARAAWALALAFPLASPEPLLLRTPGSEAPSPSGSLRVAAVQPAIPELHRHAPAAFDGNLRTLLDLSTAALADRPDLLVWPESAWERLVQPQGDAFLEAIARSLGVPILTGAWRLPRPGAAALRNAALLALPDGETRIVADKAHPVPIYERAPGGPATRWLSRRGLWGGRFEPGDAPRVVRLETSRGPVTIGALVCIDASYPGVPRQLRARGARLLLAIANEAGTGRWSAGLHERIARFRAVEGRIPVVRVANTGPSAWFDAWGRTVGSMDHARIGVATYELRLADEPPGAVRWGSAPAAAAVIASGLAALAVGGRARARAPTRRRRRHWELEAP